MAERPETTADRIYSTILRKAAITIPLNADHAKFNFILLICVKWLKVAEHSFEEPMPNSP